MVNRGRAALLLLALLAASGCAARQPSASDLPSQPFTGILTPSGNGYWFQRCEAPAESAWWVTFVDRAVSQLERARERGDVATERRTYVRWLAALTDERLVGPGGPALLVREIQELRPATPADCAR